MTARITCTCKDPNNDGKSPILNTLTLIGFLTAAASANGGNGKSEYPSGATLKGGDREGTGWLISKNGDIAGFSAQVNQEINQLVTCTFEKINSQQYQVKVQSGELKGYEIRVAGDSNEFQIKDNALKEIARILTPHHRTGAPLPSADTYNSWKNNPFAPFANPTPVIATESNKETLEPKKETSEAPKKTEAEIITPTQQPEPTIDAIPTETATKENTNSSKIIEATQGSEECIKKKPCWLHRRVKQVSEGIIEPVSEPLRKKAKATIKNIKKVFKSTFKTSYRGTPPGAGPNFKTRYNKIFKESVKWTSDIIRDGKKKLHTFFTPYSSKKVKAGLNTAGSTMLGSMGSAAATVLHNKDKYKTKTEKLKTLTVDPAIASADYIKNCFVWKGVTKGAEVLMPMVAKRLPCADVAIAIFELLKAAHESGAKGAAIEAGAFASATLGASVVICFGGNVFLAAFVGGTLSIKARYKIEQLYEAISKPKTPALPSIEEITKPPIKPPAATPTTQDEKAPKIDHSTNSAEKIPKTDLPKNTPAENSANDLKKNALAVSTKDETKKSKNKGNLEVIETERVEPISFKKNNRNDPTAKTLGKDPVIISLERRNRNTFSSCLDALLKRLGINFKGFIPFFELSFDSKRTDASFLLEKVDLSFCDQELLAQSSKKQTKKAKNPATKNKPPIIPLQKTASKVDHLTKKAKHFAKHMSEVAQMPKAAFTGPGRVLDKFGKIAEKQANKLQEKSERLAKKAEAHEQAAKEAKEFRKRLPSSLQQKGTTSLPNAQAYRDLERIERQHTAQANKFNKGADGFKFFENSARVAGGALSGAANSLKAQGENLGNSVKGSAGSTLANALTNLDQFKDSESVAKGLVFEPAKSLVLSAGKTAAYDGVAGATAAAIKAKASEKTAKKLLEKIPGADKIFMAWDVFQAFRNEKDWLAAAGSAGRELASLSASVKIGASLKTMGAFASGFGAAIAAWSVKWFINGLYYENYTRSYQLDFNYELNRLKEKTKEYQWNAKKEDIDRAVNEISKCGDEDEQQDRHNAINHFLCEAEFEIINGQCNNTHFLDLEHIEALEKSIRNIASLTISYRSRYFHEPRYFYGNQSGPIIEKINSLKANFLASVTNLFNGWEKFRKLMQQPEIIGEFQKRDLDDVMKNVKKGYPARFTNIADCRSCVEHIQAHVLELKELYRQAVQEKKFKEVELDISEFEIAINALLQKYPQQSVPQNSSSSQSAAASAITQNPPPNESVKEQASVPITMSAASSANQPDEKYHHELLEKASASSAPRNVNSRSAYKAEGYLLDGKNKFLGYPLVFYAIYLGDFDSFKKLVKDGARIDVRDKFGGNAFHALVHYFRKYTYGKNSDAPNHFLDFMAWLSQNKEPINERHLQTNYSPVLLAASYGLADVCRSFILSGANYRDTLPNGETILHILVKRSFPKDISYDVRTIAFFYKDLVNARDNEGKTPLHWSVIHNKPLLTILLLKSAADITLKDNMEKLSEDYAQGSEFYPLYKMIFSKASQGNLNITMTLLDWFEELKQQKTEESEQLMRKVQSLLNGYHDSLRLRHNSTLNSAASPTPVNNIEPIPQADAKKEKSKDLLKKIESLEQQIKDLEDNKNSIFSDSP